MSSCLAEAGAGAPIRRGRGVAVLLVMLLGACRAGEGGEVGSSPPFAPVSASLEVEAPDGAVIGAAMAVRVAASSESGRSLSALAGRLHFDPRRLRFAGQAESSHLVIVNARDAERGRLRWIALEPHGLPPRPIDLRFETLGEDAAAGLELTLDEAVSIDGGIHRAFAVAEGSRRVTGQPVGDPVLPTDEQWATRLDLRAATARWMHVAGDGLVYGDATLNGVVTGADATTVANVAVGNIPLLTPLDRDFVIAANVAPANLPGLGEADDPIPPGRGPDGTFVITAADANLIASAVVGVQVPVVGAEIPGRSVRTARVIVADSITSDRRFHRDTVYELRGTVIVGSPATADVTLTIDAGTRVEGDAASRAQLVIRRGANLLALGTRLEPVVFSCTSAIKLPGCWGGLVLNGFGVLNNGESGDAAGVGFPVKQGSGGTGRYGGNLPEDSSGVLRYVRVEYGGAIPQDAAEPVAALRLLGVGSRTVIDSVQVYAALGDALFVSGGTAMLRAIVISNPGRDGLAWEDGWQGAAQAMVLHMGASGRHGVRGSNAPGAPDAGPRSAPVLSNVTVIGPPVPVGGSAALRFEHGSAGRVHNGVILRMGATALDIDGASSCARMEDSLEVRRTIVFNPSSLAGAEDIDCADEPAELGRLDRGNRFIDPGLVAPFVTGAPDWRPRNGAAAASGAEAPPSTLIPPSPFASGIDHVGAVPPASITGSNIPWYAGWIRGF